MDKRMIAPIIITTIEIVFFVLMSSVYLYLFSVAGVMWPFLIILLIYFSFCVLSIYMCIKRIKEIRGGEIDDLSDY